MKFSKATKEQAKVRLGLVGPAGSGKTFSAILIGLALGLRVALIDSERRSALKYARSFAPLEWDHLPLESHHPERYVEAIKLAEKEGYDVLIIDSLSHAWMGKDGALEQVDRRAGASGGSFAAWRHVTPMHNTLVDTMLGANLHVIATMRAKTEWVMEKVMKGTHEVTVPRKVGLAPIQREGMDYEFDVVGDLDVDNSLTISKTRCSALARQVINRPGAEFAAFINAWLVDGEPVRAGAEVSSASGPPAEQPMIRGEVTPIVTPPPPSDVVDEILVRIEKAATLAEIDSIVREGAPKIGKEHPRRAELNTALNKNRCRVQVKAA